MMDRKKLVFTSLLVLLSLLLAHSVSSPPPKPHSIAGFIHNSDGTQVPSGTPYTVNESNTSEFITGTTSHPQPTKSGRYSETVRGNDGDIVIVSSWNDTYYGRTTVILVGNMDDVNVTINTSRRPELNITITFPSDNTILDIQNSSNTNATIKILGADGVNCNATISFSNELILNISDTGSYTNSLGNPSRGSTTSTYWNITPGSVGYTNITVTSSCANESYYFEANKKMTVYDIEVQDTAAPVVYLISPANNSASKDSNNITFYYNVSDHSDLANCTLIINNKINQTNNTAIVKNQQLNFTQYLSNGQYNWSVNCTDAYSNVGYSGFFNLTVAVHRPYVQRMTLTNPVNLISGSSLPVTCNATVVDLNGVEDILAVNATLFDSSVSASNDQDDNNYHYSDDYCTSLANTSTAMNVTCIFQMLYYSNSGNWTCNVTVFDKNTLANSSNLSTTVEELYAIEVDSFVEFGNVNPGTISQEVNVTLYNYGNMDINVTVEGYGLQEEDNLSMSCRYGGNISIENERYSLSYQQPFSNMVNLTAEPTLIENLILAQRTNDALYTNDTNTTYWKLSVPLGLKGSCNGTIILGSALT